jgi:hypothetical protein
MGAPKPSKILAALGTLGLWSAFFGISGGLCLFIAIAIHEYGHLAIAYGFGSRVQHPRFVGIGAYVQLDVGLMSDRQEGWVALAGPVTGVLVGLPLFLWALISGSAWVGLMGAMIAMVNILNMIPVPFPLDGSRIIASVLRGSGYGKPEIACCAALVLVAWSYIGVGWVLSALVWVVPLFVILAVLSPGMPDTEAMERIAEARIHEDEAWRKKPPRWLLASYAATGLVLLWLVTAAVNLPGVIDLALFSSIPLIGITT